MITEHIHQAGRELSLYTTLHHQRQKVQTITFVSGYFYQERLFYIFRITFSNHSGTLLGLIGGYSSFSLQEEPSYIHSSFDFDYDLIAPLIRTISHNFADEELEKERLLVLKEYHHCDPDHDLNYDDYTIDPLCFYEEVDPYSHDISFASHQAAFLTLKPKNIEKDYIKVKQTRFLTSQVLLNSTDFSPQEFIDRYRDCWNEELFTDCFSSSLSYLNKPVPLKSINCRNRKFSCHVGNVDVTISTTVGLKNLKKYSANHTNKSLLESDLSEELNHTRKSILVTCYDYTGCPITSDRYLIKILTALAMLPNAQVVLHNNFSYPAQLFAMAAMGSFPKRLSTSFWYPTFNLVNCHLTLHSNKRISAVTTGMNRYHFLELYIPPIKATKECVLSVLTTIGRASLEHNGNLDNKHLTLGEPFNYKVRLEVRYHSYTYQPYYLVIPLTKIGDQELPLQEPFDYSELNLPNYPLY